MNDTPTNRKGDESLPFFASSPSPFQYRVSYFYRGKILNILYKSVHELILNLTSFRNGDTIHCLAKPNGETRNVFYVGRLKTIVAKTTANASLQDLEALHLRLVLVNHYSPNITDKGLYKFSDYSLRKYLTTIRGGIDWHLMLQGNRQKMYIKFRRMSTLFLIAFLADVDQKDDIYFFHVNAPGNLPNRGLLVEVLNLLIGKSRYKLYSYDPVEGDENDVIIPTNITHQIIKTINLLIQ